MIRILRLQKKLTEAPEKKAVHVVFLLQIVFHHPVAGLEEKERDAQDADPLEKLQTSGNRQKLGNVVEHNEEHEKSPQGKNRRISQGIFKKAAERRAFCAEQ